MSLMEVQVLNIVKWQVVCLPEAEKADLECDFVVDW
jgi:hypothetical protein